MKVADYKAMRPQLYKLPAYGQVRMDGESTISLLTCDVPYLILRVNSDAFRIYEGETHPIGSDFVILHNPFHIDISAQIAIGFPVRQITRVSMTNEQATRVQSTVAFTRPATVTGQKYGYGVMTKKGTARVSYFDTTNDGTTQIILFPNCKPDFLSFKPAGAMTENQRFYMNTGDIDSNVISCGGLYSDADVLQWVTDAGYSGQVYFANATTWTSSNVMTASETCAIFVTRPVDKVAVGCIRVLHNGIDVEDFD